jgi:putative hydroxymethylpyrimidine transport system ATP-binding protein
VLLVTHDPLEALRLGHRIHIMAGQPARIEPPILPAGAPPRDLHDPTLLARQGDLLAGLADAQEAAA